MYVWLIVVTPSFVSLLYVIHLSIVVWPIVKLHIMISSTLDAEAINRAVLPSSFNLVLSKPVKTPEAVVRYTARLRLRLAAQASASIGMRYGFSYA